MHAFVAAAGVLQNAKWWQCNVAVEISEGFRQLLIVRCGCSPFRDLQNSVKNGSQQSIKRRLWGAKMEPEAKKMRSWVLRVASGLPGGSRTAKMELHRNVWVPFLIHFGVPFSPFRSLGLLSAGRFGQKGALEGVQ